ncbi:MAG: class I SAM-dependent methyltransferase [Methylophagaceae bacterium]
MTENIYGSEFSEKDVTSGAHRAAIGGLWGELGIKQLEFLIGQGLTPKDVMLDVGCGCLRGGIHFISYLDDNNYYGFDINESLLNAGYNIELDNVGLQRKLLQTNLRANECFDLSVFDKKFRYVFSFSLFTHLTINSIKRCLMEVCKVMDEDGCFYATCFICPHGEAVSLPFEQSAEITSFMDRDPYHYTISDLRWLALETGFDVFFVEPFTHPRNQKMACFTKI